VSEPHPKPPGIITRAQIRMLHHTQQCIETACLTLRLSASADVWHDPVQPHKSREKIKPHKIRIIARQVVDSAYVSRCCHNSCCNTKCEIFLKSGTRNITSNSFQLAQPETKQTSEPGRRCAASDSSRARQVMTICTNCNSRNTEVTACPGLLYLEILLSKKHSAIATAAPADSPGIAVVYFQREHSCFTAQDHSKRIGKNKMAEHAASTSHSTPNKVVHDVITEFLTQVYIYIYIYIHVLMYECICVCVYICIRSLRRAGAWEVRLNLLGIQMVFERCIGYDMIIFVTCCCYPINL
jgi:hypothetical protein